MTEKMKELLTLRVIISQIPTKKKNYSELLLECIDSKIRTEWRKKMFNEIMNSNFN